MGILYIITLIVLGIAFMIFKKSEEKLNFIKWLIIFLVSILGYNIVIGMVLGLLNIVSHIWLLSIINLIVSLGLSYKAIRYKEIQKYYVRKLDIVGIVVILILFGVMFVKDLYIYNGDISHFAVDSAVHYRAAKHYSENLKIFINVEDKTFFNFNVMQTGAYINDGILMNVINDITGLSHEYIYQIFETLILFLSGLAFYAAFIEKIKTKRGLFGSLVLFALYIYGYPYNSWIHGFSYLSVGIAMVAMLIPVVEMLYSKENINKTLIISLIALLGTGLIFSYCLFVPAIFSAICIYCFLRDLLNKDEKKFLKIFGKRTLIVTIVLLIITGAGIGYLFIPTFFIEGQTNLVDALKIDGQIYNEKYSNFLPYVPFAIMYAVEIIRKIKNKELEYSDIFAIIIMGFFAVLNLGEIFDLVSQYYMFKIYFILWIVIFNVTIELVNKYVDEKNIRIDLVILGLLYAFLVFKGISPVTIIKIFIVIAFVFYVLLADLLRNFRINGFALISVYVIYRLLRGADFVTVFKLYLFTFLIFYTALPAVMKKVDVSKLKDLFEKIVKKLHIKPICISGYVYVTIWALFVCAWVFVKSGPMFTFEERIAFPNFVGIYYTENCDHRNLIDLESNFNKGEIELAKYARNNIEDLSADNIMLMTSGYFNRIWATAMLEITSDNMPYQNFVQDSLPYTYEDGLKDQSKKYLVRLVWNELQRQNAYKEEIKQIRENENIEILFENENGYVAKIKR